MILSSQLLVLIEDEDYLYCACPIKQKKKQRSLPGRANFLLLSCSCNIYQSQENCAHKVISLGLSSVSITSIHLATELDVAHSMGFSEKYLATFENPRLFNNI